MEQVEVIRDKAPGRARRKPNHIRRLLSLRQFGANGVIAAQTDTDRTLTIGAAASQHAVDGRATATNHQKTTRPKAIVVDPDESGRGFVADVLMLFEPGFDVVTVAGVEEAAEWTQTFVPDLMVVSEALEHDETSNFVATVLAAPPSRHCKVVSVGQTRNEAGAVAPWRHAAIEEGASLSVWLETVRHLLAL